MKVLVCGGRKYRRYEMVNGVLRALHRELPITRVIHGGATGADTLAGLWASRYGIPVDVYEADWKLPDGTIDRSAGTRRNTLMLTAGDPDVVVAYPGGNGTANMVKQARAKHLRTGYPFVLEVNEASVADLSTYAAALALAVTLKREVAA